MKQNIFGGIAVIALVLSIVGLVGGNQPVSKLGGTTNYDAITLDNGNLTVSKGNISVLNTSTSTITVGNIQTLATSSATTICIVPSATGATSSFSGTVYFKYGTCPF